MTALSPNQNPYDVHSSAESFIEGNKLRVWGVCGGTFITFWRARERLSKMISSLKCGPVGEDWNVLQSLTLTAHATKTLSALEQEEYHVRLPSEIHQPNSFNALLLNANLAEKGSQNCKPKESPLDDTDRVSQKYHHMSHSNYSAYYAR